MSRENNNLYSDPEVRRVLDKYNEMLRLKTQYFFDVHEFESIIEYFLSCFNFYKAREAVELAINQHPDSSAIKLKQAKVYVEIGKPDLGLQLLEKLQHLESNNQDFYIIQGYAYAVKGNIQKATQRFDVAINVLFKPDVEIILDVVNILQQLNLYEVAIQYLFKALELEKNNSAVVYELAHCYELIGEYSRSIKYYKLFLDHKPYSSHVWHNLGMAYSLNEEYSEAVDAYDFAIVIDEKYATAYFNKACALRSMNQYNEAILAFKEFLTFEETNVQAECFIAECYERLEDYTLALDYYDRVIIKDKTFADGWFGYGFVLKLQGKPDLAIPYIKQALSFDNSNTEYLYVLGESYYECENHDLSEDCLKQLIELDPLDYEAWLLYSKLYFDKDQLQQAIDILYRAYDNLSECAPLNFRLAAYYFTCHNYNQARRFFREGLNLCKNNEEIHEIIELYSPIISDAEFQEFLK